MPEFKHRRLVQQIPESVIRDLAAQSGPESAAAKVLAEGEEIKSRGNMVCYWLTDEPSLCCQEGIAYVSTEKQ